jgi:CRISPR-associated protein Cas1
MKERISSAFIEKGEIDVLDGAFVMVDQNGVRTHIPVGSIAVLMLEPGTRVPHRAAALAARVGPLLVRVGEAGVRLYTSGQPAGARSNRLLYQARLALDEGVRLEVVRNKMYELLAKRHGVKWKHRAYDVEERDSGDLPNRCLSSATVCPYGITVAVRCGRPATHRRSALFTRQALIFRLRHRQPVQIRYGKVPEAVCAQLARARSPH